MSESRATRALLTCGAAGPVLFLLLFHLDAVTRPGYELLRHGPSLLMTGDRGTLQVLNFVLAGLLALACAVGLRRTITHGRAATWGPRLMAVYGIGVICTALFRTDPEEGYPPGTPTDRLPGTNYPSTWHSTLHTPSVILLFASATATCFVFARRFATEPGGRPWAACLVAIGVAAPTMLALGISISAIPALTTLDGILGRAIIPLGFIWATLIPLRLLTGNHNQHS